MLVAQRRGVDTRVTLGVVAVRVAAAKVSNGGASSMERLWVGEEDPAAAAAAVVAAVVAVVAHAAAAVAGATAVAVAVAAAVVPRRPLSHMLLRHTSAASS